MKNIFIATPITGLIDKNGIFPSIYKKRLTYIYNSLKPYGNVFCAIIEEKWGKDTPNEPIYTKRDFNYMFDADIVIAFPSMSYGVCIELGWASALNKNIYVINSIQKLSTPLIKGLSSISNLNIISMESLHLPTEEEWEKTILPKIKGL